MSDTPGAPFDPLDFRNVGTVAEGKTPEDLDREAIAWAAEILGRAIADVRDLRAEDWDTLAGIVLRTGAELDALHRRAQSMIGMRVPPVTNPEGEGLERLVASCVTGGKGAIEWARKFPDTDIARDWTRAALALRVLSFVAAYYNQQTKFLRKSVDALQARGPIRPGDGRPDAIDQAITRIAPLPAELRLATGHIMRELGQRIPIAWTHEALIELTTQQERRFIVKLVGTGGAGVRFHPDLPGMSSGAIDADKESLLAALARALPDWYTLKIIDACHTFALDDAKKDGGFWYHPARFAELLGLRGRKIGDALYYTTHEKRRFDERFRDLMALEVEVTIETRTHRPGKGWRKSLRPFGKMKLLSFDGDAVKPIHLHANGRGRPAEARRVKVSSFTWAEAKRFHVGLTGTARKFYALRDPAAFKVARYLLTRAAMAQKGRGALEIREDLAGVEQYAGLSADRVREALPYLKELGIEASVDAQGVLEAKIPAGALRFRGRKTPRLAGPKA